jgi:hypothetical protein
MKEMANTAAIVQTSAELNVMRISDNVAYENLDESAKLNYIDPETAATAAYWGAFGTSTVAGAGAGFGIGAAAGGGIGSIPASVIGLIVGGVAGAIGGDIAGDAAAEAAAEAARANNDQYQYVSEQLAKALAKGDLVDTGSGYKIVEGMTV